MKDLAAALVIALLIYLGACFVSFEPDIYRWDVYGRFFYLAGVVVGFSSWKLFMTGEKK